MFERNAYRKCTRTITPTYINNVRGENYRRRRARTRVIKLFTIKRFDGRVLRARAFKRLDVGRGVRRRKRFTVTERSHRYRPPNGANPFPESYFLYSPNADANKLTVVIGCSSPYVLPVATFPTNGRKPLDDRYGFDG